MLKRRWLKRAGACALLAGLSGAPAAPRADAGATPAQWPGSVQAQYRGCESAEWCWFQPAAPHAQSLLRVRPAGIAAVHGDGPVANAVRDRLNALLASMIHQHKRIVLHDLRELPDGTFEAEVTVNEASLSQDPLLSELAKQIKATH